MKEPEFSGDICAGGGAGAGGCAVEIEGAVNSSVGEDGLGVDGDSVAGDAVGADIEDWSAGVDIDVGGVGDGAAAGEGEGSGGDVGIASVGVGAAESEGAAGDGQADVRCAVDNGTAVIAGASNECENGLGDGCAALCW